MTHRAPESMWTLSFGESIEVQGVRVVNLEAKPLFVRTNAKSFKTSRRPPAPYGVTRPRRYLTLGPSIRRRNYE